MHNRGEVAKATKEKILKIVKELDFQPNILASTLASKKSAQFATLLPQPPSTEGYWNKPFLGIQKRISELKQYGVSIEAFTFSQTDPNSFELQANKILDLHPDGIVMAPFFSKESNRFIEQLKDKNIPFVFIDSEIKGAGHLSYIGQNSFQSGMVSGKLLDLLTNSDTGILVIHFAIKMDNQNHLVKREKGFYEWFKSSSKKNHSIFTFEVTNEHDEKWQEQLMAEIINKKITGIFVTSSKVFHVGRLIKKFELKNISLIGHDLLKENIQFLKDGIVDFLICQRPEEQGYNAINKLFRNVVQKREVSTENYTSIDIITKENVDYYKEFK